MKFRAKGAIRLFFCYLHSFRVRILSGYFFKNWIERRSNRFLLKQIRETLGTDSKNETPLVSVLIPTYSRANILVERAIPSVLKQTYQNFEIIIVGDHCTNDQVDILSNLVDERIKFYNLPKRGDYPRNLSDQWMVAGVVPRNKAIELCSGDWIAPLDDDDEFSEDHIEILLNYALIENHEMVYGKVKMEKKLNEWTDLGSYPCECGKISHISVLYHSKLKFFKYDINSWKYEEPADWNMWRRMKEAGVRIGFIDRVVGRHYLEGSQKRE